MARELFALCTLLLSLGPAFGQRPPDDPPVAGRPENFSNIVGNYKIAVFAEPTEVRVEEAITLRIWITGTGPEKYEPNRKHLRLFPDSWERDFYVLPLPDEDIVYLEKSWEFVYRLKPKHDKINAIDGITLWSYNPDRPGKMKFVPDFAKSIAIKVRPKLDQTDALSVDVPAVPDSFYAVADGKDVLASPTATAINGWQLALLLALPPLACLGGAVAYRRFWPDDAQLMRERRRAAAGRALERLRSGACAWEVVRQYLADRFDFPGVDPTPADASAFLKRRGFARAVGEQARAFFAASDAMRYADSVSATMQLADEANRLIQALETDPCARG